MITAILTTVQLVLNIAEKVIKNFDEKKKEKLFELRKELLKELNKPTDYSEDARDDNKIVYLLGEINLMLETYSLEIEKGE